MSIASAPLRHNPVTLHLHHLSQRLTRLSQWSGCWTHPSARIYSRLAQDADGAAAEAGGVVAESARHGDPPRAAADRAGGSAHRRLITRAAAQGRRQRAHRQRCRSAPRGNDTFNHAKSGDCLNWPDRTPDSAEIVDCKDEHRFEVAESVDMRTFPGSEYGPDAAPPSPARIQQISQEQCSAAVKNYLGARFDPNSRFTVSMLWSGDKAWRQAGERRMLCGLQLPGPNNQQLAFKGKVADVDQSKVWSAGTCLGIDPSTNQPTDIPVDCAAPHAMEVTGAVNLAEKFPQALPPEPDQDAFIKDACTRMTDAYLAPIQLRSTTLTLIYSTISLPSWSAGSHQVSCSIGATLGNGGWSTLLNSAKGPLMINGQPPVPPPDIPGGPAEPAAHPGRRAAGARHLFVFLIFLVVAVAVLDQPDRPGSADPAHARATVDGSRRPPRPPRPRRGRRLRHRATRSSTAHRRRWRRRMRHHRPTARRPRRARLPARLLCRLPQEAAPPPPPAPGPPPAEPFRRHRHQGSSRVAVRMSPQRFDELVSDALDLIPPELAAAIDNVVVLVEDRSTRRSPTCSASIRVWR